MCLKIDFCDKHLFNLSMIQPFIFISFIFILLYEFIHTNYISFILYSSYCQRQHLFLIHITSILVCNVCPTCLPLIAVFIVNNLNRSTIQLHILATKNRLKNSRHHHLRRQTSYAHMGHFHHLPWSLFP